MPTKVSNPFSTRFTRPGSIAPLDASGSPVDMEALLDRLRDLGGTAAIVGPHGSGKSTLLTHLAAAIERHGTRAPRVRLHSWTDAPLVWMAIRQAGPDETLCIDSWESIGWLIGGLLRMVARATGRRLLVTSHSAAGFPELARCTTSPALLHSIVESLPNHRIWFGSLIRESDIGDAFATHGGNLRESLYELYDRFEASAFPFQGQDGADSVDRTDHAGTCCEIHEFADGFSCRGAPERNLG